MVVLANGNEAKAEGTPTAPPGWGADKTRWTLSGDPFDVAWFKLIG
jgi:hypothetical protein